MGGQEIEMEQVVLSPSAILGLLSQFSTDAMFSRGYLDRCRIHDNQTIVEFRAVDFINDNPHSSEHVVSAYDRRQIAIRPIRLGIFWPQVLRTANYESRKNQ